MSCRGIEIEPGVFSGCNGGADCPVCHGMAEADGGDHIYPGWSGKPGAVDGDPAQDVEKFAQQLIDIEREVAAMTPEQAMKIARGLVNYGRAEIRIPLHNLFGLFDGKNVGIVHIEYDIHAEQLCFIVEGDGLPLHPEGSRPFVVPGRFTGGSYIMADVRGEWIVEKRSLSATSCHITETGLGLMKR